jgi:YHS domain-containing protein
VAYPQGMPVFDPICGMWLEGDKGTVTFAYFGEMYPFCCEECRDLFARAPEAHIVRLAHEPTTSAGHRCPYQRLENGSSVARPGQEAPRA